VFAWKFHKGRSSAVLCYIILHRRLKSRCSDQRTTKQQQYQLRWTLCTNMTEVTPYNIKKGNVQACIIAEFRLIIRNVCWNVTVNNEKNLDQGRWCETFVFRSVYLGSSASETLRRVSLLRTFQNSVPFWRPNMFKTTWYLNDPG